LDFTNLPSDPEELKAIIVKIASEKEDLNNSLLSSINKLTEENTNLKFELKTLQSKLFGKKSESWTREENSQALLFDEIETFSPEPDPLKASQKIEEPLLTKVQSYHRKKSGRIQIPDSFPVEEILHDLKEEEKICSCGNHLTTFGSEKLDKVDILPPQIKVTRHIRPKYICKACHGLDNIEESAVKIAPPVPQFLPKAIADIGMLAYIITAKFCDSLPFYRLSNIFTRFGFEISRTTLCNYAKKTKERLEFLEKDFWNSILESPFLQIDETPVRVLKEKSDKQSKSFMFVIRGGTTDNPILKFIYHPTRSAKFLMELLKEYKGIVLTDGYPSYDSVLESNSNIIHAGCWTHTRRMFHEVYMLNKTNAEANKILLLIRELYVLDAKASLLSLEEKKKHRQMNSKPVVEEIRKIMENQIPRTMPKSPLGKAYSYMAGQWHKLLVFLDHPEIPLDTNLVENAIRPFVIGRKNWLFSGTSDGAEASAFLYSLIETAKANKKEPYRYLKSLFQAVEQGQCPKLLEVG